MCKEPGVDKFLARANKARIYKAVIIPSLTYASEMTYKTSSQLKDIRLQKWKS